MAKQSSKKNPIYEYLPGLEERLEELGRRTSPEFRNKLNDLFSGPVLKFDEALLENTIIELKEEDAKIAAFEEEWNPEKYTDDREKIISRYFSKKKEFAQLRRDVLGSSVKRLRSIDQYFSETMKDAKQEGEKIRQSTIRDLMQASEIYFEHMNVLKRQFNFLDEKFTENYSKIKEYYIFTKKMKILDKKIEALLADYQNAQEYELGKIAGKFEKLKKRLEPKEKWIYAYKNPIPACVIEESKNFDASWIEKRKRIEQTKDEIRYLEGDCTDKLRALLRIDVCEPKQIFLREAYNSFVKERKLKAASLLVELVSRLANFTETATDFEKDNKMLKEKEAEYLMAKSCYKLFELESIPLLEKQGEKLAGKRKDYSKIENMLEPVIAETEKINRMCDFDAKELEKIKLDENKFDSINGNYFKLPVENYKLAVQRAQKLLAAPAVLEQTGAEYFDLEKHLDELGPSNALYVRLQDILKGKHTNGNVMERFDVLEKELEIFPDAQTIRDRNYLEGFRSVVKNWTAHGAIKSIVENSKDNQYQVGIVMQMLDKIIERSKRNLGEA